MANTLAQAQAAINDFRAIIVEATVRASNITNRYESINQSSPEALDQLKALREEYNAGAAEFNPKIKEFNSRAVDIVNGMAPGPDKDAMRAAYQQVTPQLSALSSQLRTVRDQINASIAALTKAAEEKTKTAESVPAENKDQAAPATNDDAGAGAKPPETAAETNTTAAPSNTTQTPGNSGTVVNNAPNSNTSPTKPNPLGNLSSYTYGLSLYMINTDVMNRFIAGGGTMAGITGDSVGVRVVAQSGGYSDTDRTLTGIDVNKNLGQRVDYYIDDLNLTTFLPGGPQKATASTEIKFKITEPVGFAFLQDLARAGQRLNAESNVKAPNMNGIQQHFIIGIKFYGYDVDGNVITQVPANPKGGDQNPGSLPERYFAIRITKVKFKLDGRIVTYQCEAVVVSESIANGQVNGLVKSTTTLSGSTVWEVLANPSNKSSLVSVLNAATASDKDSNRVKIPITYAIEFLENGVDVGKKSNVAKQKIINDATFDNKIAKTFTISDAEKASIAQQFKAVTIDNKTGSIQLSRGQTILTVIDNIITKSEYITESLNQISKTGAETETKTNTPAPFKWYTVNPVITAKGFDTQTNDWSYEIKFQISEYEVAYLRTVNATKVSTYNGPSKKYNYWLTGENTEILSYEQNYDNLFYVMTVATRSPAPNGNESAGNAPVKSQSSQGVDSNGSENRQFQFNENVVAQMYSPGDQATARIRIMGDPDYIMTSTGVNYAKSIGKNTSGLDPLKGQVFIQIKFLMATDYGDNGVLNVSNNIEFYGDQIIKDLNIDGVVYKVIRVDSVFVKGTFSQTLTCVLVDQRLLSNDRNRNKNKNGKSSEQRSESDAENARLLARYPAPPNNQSDAETARLSRQNSSLIRPPASVDLRTPQSSQGRGVQQILNPPKTDNPTTAQLKSSPEYNAARLAGQTGPQALNTAREAFRANFNKDDQYKNSQAQSPSSRTNDDGRQGGR